MYMKNYFNRWKFQELKRNLNNQKVIIQDLIQNSIVYEIPLYPDWTPE